MRESRHYQSRRSFLQSGALVLLGSTARWQPAATAEPAEPAPRLRVALVTDIHYADRPAGGTRFYRDSLAKFAEAAGEFKKLKTDFLVCLGDCIDSGADIDAEKGHVRAVVKAFDAAPRDRHFVVGNHCVSALTKPEFLDMVGQKESCYSFDRAGWHFVVLDACYRSDGQPYGRKNFDWKDANVPAAQIEWLRADLSKTDSKCIVLIHQPLDVKPPHGVKNAADVRKVLDEPNKVRAVLQGHDHRGGYQKVGAIHYCTLRAMVEGRPPDSSAYAVLDILGDDALRLTGYRRQPSHAWG